MTFKNIVGNDQLIERLRETICGKGVTHAYVFEGDYYTDKLAFANSFAKAILCETNKGTGCETCISCIKIEHGNHEDVYYAEVTDKGNTKDEEINKLQIRLSNKPYIGERNIAIIKDADSMTLKAQNRLLKTLEEPQPGTVIILLSNNVQNLTQTILSRCVVFRINPEKLNSEKQKFEFEEEIAQMLLENEPFYKIKLRMNGILKDKEASMKFLDGMERVYRDLLILNTENSRLYKKTDVNKIVSHIEEARRDLQIGVNTAYSLKNMILKIGG
ncbi:MAG: hypothetical protein JJE49_00065 [Peptostreptococcaceae bacterium]|nr:hypothetical protein [Peptostreptococcaceae bacterium]